MKIHKIHKIRIQNKSCAPCLDYIRKGIKTVEGRKYSSMYFNMKPNDIIIFENSFDQNDEVYAKIIYINKYKTLEDYLKSETIEKTLPWIKTFDEAIRVYNSFTSQEERNKK